MSSRKVASSTDSNLECVLISNFIRLCVSEGAESESAYKELERRLEALNELKPHREHREMP